MNKGEGTVKKTYHTGAIVNRSSLGTTLIFSITIVMVEFLRKTSLEIKKIFSKSGLKKYEQRVIMAQVQYIELLRISSYLEMYILDQCVRGKFKPSGWLGKKIPNLARG